MSNTVITIEAETVSTPRRHTIAKAKRWSALLAKFVSVQIIVQAIGLVTGLFLVRMLSQRQYAFFTIANTMQGTMGILADSGISIGLSAIGGKVWQDRYRFGQLISTALNLRKTLAAVSITIVTPILIWMLIKNGAPALYAIFIAATVLLGVSAQLTTGVMEVVPRLHSQVNRLQKLDLYSALLRLFLLGGAYLVSLNAAFAVLAASTALLLKNRLLRHWVKGDIDVDAPPLETDRTEIIGIVKQQLPNAIFYCVQGQVTVWLISIFGNATSIAEVGALGRLAVLFSIIGSVVGNIVSPAFARCQSPKLLMLRYWQILATYSVFCAVLFGLTTLFPKQILWVLGGQYKHLDHELLLIMLSAIVSAFSAVMWALNMAKGWVKNAWLYIPATLVTQIILLMVLNIRTVPGVILFGLYSIVPSILLNFYMTLWGLHSVNNPDA